MRNISLVLFSLILPFFLVLENVSANTYVSNSSKDNIEVNEDKLKKIETTVNNYMEKGKIPGLSIVIVEDDRVIYSKGFGYADLESKQPVNSETLFELGSNSKAFTGLAILKLAEEGKINLEAPINEYLPWLKLKYSGKNGSQYYNGYVNVTLNQLMYHTSGIPTKTISQIPISSSSDALEKTVMTINDQELEFYPGTKFNYATINYDILGLVIEYVTEMSFEDYITKHVLDPLELNQTYVSRNNPVVQKNIAKGYKYSFLKTREFNAPEYRGNLPAGYFITNSNDLAHWIKLQLGVYSGTVNKTYKQLIELSHHPNRKVSPSVDGTSYAAGWNVLQSGKGELRHGGANPNFSSYITLRPGEQLGVGVLANINSSYTNAIGQEVMNILNALEPVRNVSDDIQYIDKVAVVALIITFPLTIFILAMLSIKTFQIIKKERCRKKGLNRIFIELFLLILFVIGFGFCLYKIPNIIYFDHSWSFLMVWGPSSILPAVIMVFTFVTSFCLLFILTGIYPKKDEKSLFIASILSIVSGLGNALLIIIINEMFSREINKFQFNLLLYFIMGLIIYVAGQRLVRGRLLRITNQIVYEKRVTLIREVQGASFEKFQMMEDSEIQTALNNDTESISVVANIIVTAFTSIVTLITCFIYISLINFYGFLLSFVIIIIASSFYFLVGRYANSIYEQTRDIQNLFFRYINELIGGFKELKINNKKQLEFQSDMIKNCEDYRDQKVKAALAFANVFVAGEILFTVVIGVVVFVFPVIFKEMESLQIRNYIFIFLYMTGPVNSVLNTIPELLRTNVSYKRINRLINVLSKEKEKDKENKTSIVKDEHSSIHLRLEDVTYSYANNGGNLFEVGPINCEFKSGEITFITGGNGSGKTTLGNIITGLYHPLSGKIYLNNKEISPEQLSQRFSAIFSDFFIFNQLYGIDYEDKIQEIDKYLNILRIEDKVSIEDGFFSTTKLSTGQRKRLGLLLSYLEDKEILFFDEWAADQEPVFREFFYKNLLQELKERGKCIISITHDDRYFSSADKIIEMELGKLIDLYSDNKKNHKITKITS